VTSARARRLSSTLAALALIGCAKAPRPLVAGTDPCDFCRMTISDVRFGAELQSRTGKIHTFDSIECLASFYVDAAERDDVRGTWVTDFEGGGMIPVDSAVFLEGSRIRSPMGRSMVAFAGSMDPGALVERHGGTVLRWEDVVDRMRTERLKPGASQPTVDTATTSHHHGSA